MLSWNSQTVAAADEPVVEEVGTQEVKETKEETAEAEGIVVDRFIFLAIYTHFSN